MFLVLFGKCAQRQAAAESVQALAVGQETIGQYRGVHDIAVDADDAQGHQPVVEQQHVALAHVLHQAQVTDADLGGVTGRRIRAADQRKGVAGFQRDLAGGEFFDADLGALQVGQDADLPSLPRGRFANGADARLVVFGRAVGKIQADDVDARPYQVVEHAGRVGRRAEGGEDLGAAQIEGHGCGFR